MTNYYNFDIIASLNKSTTHASDNVNAANTADDSTCIYSIVKSTDAQFNQLLDARYGGTRTCALIIAACHSLYVLMNFIVMSQAGLAAMALQSLSQMNVACKLSFFLFPPTTAYNFLHQMAIWLLVFIVRRHALKLRRHVAFSPDELDSLESHQSLTPYHHHHMHAMRNTNVSQTSTDVDDDDDDDGDDRNLRRSHHHHHHHHRATSRSSSSCGEMKMKQQQQQQQQQSTNNNNVHFVDSKLTPIYSSPNPLKLPSQQQQQQPPNSNNGRFIYRQPVPPLYSMQSGGGGGARFTKMPSMAAVATVPSGKRVLNSADSKSSSAITFAVCLAVVLALYNSHNLFFYSLIRLKASTTQTITYCAFDESYADYYTLLSQYVLPALNLCLFCAAPLVACTLQVLFDACFLVRVRREQAKRYESLRDQIEWPVYAYYAVYMCSQVPFALSQLVDLAAGTTKFPFVFPLFIHMKFTSHVWLVVAEMTLILLAYSSDLFVWLACDKHMRLMARSWLNKRIMCRSTPLIDAAVKNNTLPRSVAARQQAAKKNKSKRTSSTGAGATGQNTTTSLSSQSASSTSSGVGVESAESNYITVNDEALIAKKMAADDDDHAKLDDTQQAQPAPPPPPPPQSSIAATKQQQQKLQAPNAAKSANSNSYASSTISSTSSSMLTNSSSSKKHQQPVTTTTPVAAAAAAAAASAATMSMATLPAAIRMIDTDNDLDNDNDNEDNESSSAPPSTTSSKSSSSSGSGDTDQSTQRQLEKLDELGSPHPPSFKSALHNLQHHHRMHHSLSSSNSSSHSSGSGSGHHHHRHYQNSHLHRHASPSALPPALELTSSRGDNPYQNDFGLHIHAK